MPCEAAELAKVKLFELLDDEELGELAAVIDLEKLEAGKTLFNAGDFGESLYIIRSGEVELFIKDNLGQIYGINANGQVILVGKAIPMTMTFTELNTLSSDKGSVVFTQPEPIQKPFYAFDAYQEAYNKDLLWREKYEKLGTYGVGRKAGAPGKPDIINARVLLTDPSLKADSVRFITAKGTQYTSRSLGAGMYEVNVVGGPDGDGQELYALHPKADGKYFSLGKVAVFSYTPQKQKLILVPVNGATYNKNIIAEI